MAIKLAERYPTRASDPSLDYPTGSFKNKSAPGAVDGTPLEKDWANDILGFRDALLDAAAIVADGNIDTAQSSQTFDALTAYIAAAIPDTPTQTQSIWNEGESTTESKISPLKLDTKIKNHSLGDGQTWQNLVASRTGGVTYTNTTGRTIIVSISVNPGTAVAVLTVNSINVAITTNNPDDSATRDNLSAPVPNGATYILSGAVQSLELWAELR